MGSNVGLVGSIRLHGRSVRNHRLSNHLPKEQAILNSLRNPKAHLVVHIRGNPVYLAKIH